MSSQIAISTRFNQPSYAALTLIPKKRKAPEKNSPEFILFQKLRRMLQSIQKKPWESLPPPASYEELEQEFNSCDLKQWIGENCNDIINSIPLSNNQLERLPSQIFLFQTIKILDISQNSFTAIPKEVFSLTYLEMLNISWNPIEEIPEEIGQLKKLRKLFASNTQTLKKVALGLRGCATLKHANFNDNRLSFFEECPFPLSLKSLVINRNQLNRLPEDFGNLKLLKTLEISSNHLSTLPDSFQKLTSLRKLEMNDNQLQKIPPQIYIQSLEVLHLKRNQITKVPESLTRLLKLRELCVQGNRIAEVPASIRESKTIRYLRIEAFA